MTMKDRAEKARALDDSAHPTKGYGDPDLTLASEPPVKDEDAMPSYRTDLGKGAWYGLSS